MRLLAAHRTAKRLIKGEALACKGFALDCFPKENHGFPEENNLVLCTSLLFKSLI